LFIDSTRFVVVVDSIQGKWNLCFGVADYFRTFAVKIVVLMEKECMCFIKFFQIDTIASKCYEFVNKFYVV
jgi:hypothetical protein